MSENGFELGKRVRYQDYTCKGIGFVRAINPHNKGLVLVEVEDKDLSCAGFVLKDSAQGYELATANESANLRMFWKKELEGR